MDTSLLPCPANWEYQDVPNHNAVLSTRTADLLRGLRLSGNGARTNAARDTRTIHAVFFAGLTPAHFDYFAGHYRGENYRCLKDYNVHVPGDPRVGHAAHTVPAKMDALATDIARALIELDFAFAVPNAVFSSSQKLFRAVELSAAIFVYFLEIHPYANGNGHMARLIVQAILSRYDIYFNAAFQTHPRPNEPAYSQAIVQYRNNHKEPLHVLFMGCL